MSDFKSDKEYRALKSRFDVYYVEKLLPLLMQAEKFRAGYVRNFWTLFSFAAVLYPILLLIIFSIKWSEDNPQIGIAISLSAIAAAIV